MTSVRRVARSCTLACLPFLLSATHWAAPALSAEPLFRFAAVADTHIAHPTDMVRFRMFLHTIRQEKIDFLLMLGDICGHAPEYLPQIKQVAELSGLKVYPLPGNHDDNYARNSQWYGDVFGKMYYSFGHKGHHVVMNWSQSQPLEWVKKDLAAVPKGTPIIFCQHYPPPRDVPESKEPWATVLKHANVKLILAGHQHRHADGRLGAIRSVVLRNCSFDRRVANPGSYYVMEVHPRGRVAIRQKPLAGLKLLSPPDKLPSVIVAAPSAGEALRGAATFRGTAADDKAVRKVQYSIDYGPWRPADGTTQWRFSVDTARLADDHHLFRVRSVDSAGQASLKMPLLLRLVANAPARGGAFRFQQGVGGYTGCTDATVRRHGERKSPTGSDGELSDLENWVWKAGEVEYSEFYIRFDLSKAEIPPDAKIRRVTLTVYGSRQNGVKSAEDDRGYYAVGVMRRKWNASMTFKARPAQPGWTGRRDLDPRPALTGKWPYLGGRQIVMPPKPVMIDLTALKEHIREWIAEPSSNHGLVFSPFGNSYNFSAKSSRCSIPTLRPRLDIEMETK